MKTLLLDVNEQCIKFVDVKDSLEEFYELLNCDVIDITKRNIGGVVFDVMCDDEGLLKEGAIVSAFDSNGTPALVGNLMFFHTNPYGNLVGISDEECQHLIGCSETYLDMAHLWVCPAITRCDYAY